MPTPRGCWNCVRGGWREGGAPESEGFLDRDPDVEEPPDGPGSHPQADPLGSPEPKAWENGACVGRGASQGLSSREQGCRLTSEEEEESYTCLTQGQAGYHYNSTALALSPLDTLS